ncbi:hypothetical protein E4K72_18520 [Oxalobacteraceae bacterium OM1]|nr:hypothetical protein E4K72_18520 [Oxalobacteraceae bacterium OM1]
MELHIVHYIGPIHAESASTVRNLCLMALKDGAARLELHLSTEGGNTTAGFALYNFLKALPVPLTTHNIGSVESIGVPIFLAGGERFAAPRTRFLIHPLHWGFGDLTSADHGRISEWRDCLDFDAERYREVFDEATCNAGERIDITPCLRSHARIFTPPQARAAGIIHAERPALIPARDKAVHWWAG